MQYQIICVVIMALASYIPRFIPITFLKKQIKSRYVQSFLYYMPYAVLAALTFPSILYSVDNIWIAIVGTVTAITLSILNQKMIIVVIITVLVVFGLIIIL